MLERKSGQIYLRQSGGEGGFKLEEEERETIRRLAVRSLAEIEALERPGEIKVIHLIGTKAANIPAVERLVERCPNLTAVQVSPTLARKVLSKTAQMIFEEKDVELQIKAYADLPSGTEIIRSIDEVNQLANPTGVERAHLSRQEAVGVDTITRLLEVCPDLTTISIAPCLVQSKLSPIAKRNLAESGLEIKIERLKDGPGYDSLPTKDYEAKKAIYEDMLTNPEKEAERNLFNSMEEYGFEAAEMLKLHLREKTMTIGKIADEMGLPYRRVQTNVMALLHLIGYPYSDKNVLARSRVLLRRLAKVQERGSYKVGDILPPKTLLRSRWPMWQKIMQARLDNPNRWSWLTENYPINYRVLISFYQIEEARGKKITYSEIAKQLGVTRQRVGQHKKRAVELLIGPEKRPDYLETLEDLEEVRATYAVDGLLPPLSLQTDRWETWQKIMQIRKNEPNRWRELRIKYPDYYQILLHSFQLDEASGEGSTD